MMPPGQTIVLRLGQPILQKDVQSLPVPHGIIDYTVTKMSQPEAGEAVVLFALLSPGLAWLSHSVSFF